MTASYNDQQQLSGDATFQNRVRQSLMKTCISIASEGWAVAFHRERATYAASVVASADTFKLIFSQSVATDATVISDATQAGTVALTGGNVAAQAALVTDAHIDAAISSQFNTFFRCPGN
jgi:hypothetical protein